MENTHTTLDIAKLKKKTSKIISSKEALDDVTKIDWSEDVLNGKETVAVTGKQEK